MDTKSPSVSVVMPVYKAERFIQEAVESILNQTLLDFELIIVCDDPSDTTRVLLQAFQHRDQRIKVIFQERAGLTPSLNKGFSLARGEYIARMDADDISHPDRLKKQVEFLNNHPDCALVCTYIEYIDESGRFSGYWNADIKAKSSQDIRRMLPIKNCIAQPTVMIRSGVAKQYQYDPALKIAEDYDLWLRMSSDRLHLCKLPEFLLKYRRHTSSLSNQVIPVSLRIHGKWTYLHKQVQLGGFSRFNIKVFFFLIADCILWPFLFTCYKLRILK